ncbi:MAG: MFS transporter [Planctomycetes bacterium]|nr:MFS transporter [Planctomycetota bacterium]
MFRRMSILNASGQATERHPSGLFLLFFAEMWERFSFYGMRALLVFYMTKGFLKADDTRAYAVYGAYGALVYATPYLGGMISDRFLGARLSVIWGGLLMAAGHLLLTVEREWAFFGALGLLICGNGFFKPNISTMVGALYAPGSMKRDAGFTLFYMGINLGAALAPLVCGYIGETYGFHYGFGLATVGMLTGLATFVAPAGVARGLILLAVAGLLATMLWGARDNALQLALNAPVALALLAAGLVSFIRLSEGSVPAHVGRAPGRLGQGPLLVTVVATLVAVPLMATLTSRTGMATWLLNAVGILAFGSILWGAMRSDRVERDRLIVVVVLCFFSMLFWAFFEQAGSSVNNFTDRNVSRVVGTTPVETGKRYELVPVTQEFLGHEVAGRTWTLADIDQAEKARTAASTIPGAPGDAGFVSFTASEANAKAGLAVGGSEIKASVFQAANPMLILIFGLPFTLLWGWLGARGRDPSAPVKFALGILQLSAGFGALWMGAVNADSHGMVAIGWLILSYLLQTTGELCLSPVGLSLVTRLSPVRMVSTIMGAWFLATSFSHLLAAAIARATAVSGEGEAPALPLAGLAAYREVFGFITIAAAVSALALFVIAPRLRRMMHEETLAAPSGH